MPTITIKNVPNTFEKYTFSYDEVYFLPKNQQRDITPELHTLINDENNTSVGPFEGAQVSEFLNSFIK